MLRTRKHLANGALLDDMAVFHHGHAVSEAPHQIEVVRDKQDGHAVTLLQFGQQVENLHPQRYIQCGGGLVGQQQFGLTGQCHGDHGALALTARQLVRKRLGSPLRLGNTGAC